MADTTPGVSKTVAALAAGALCVIVGNVLNHLDTGSLSGVSLAMVMAFKQSDSMSALQTLITAGLVYFIPHSTTT